MKQSVISVIIPVYNVEKYLRRCVDSVLNQTYKNLEVILVDDGSPDGAPFICDEYARTDRRVHVIHKKNGGLSSARNAGLDYNLTGKYVTFIDSDDWIAPDYYEYSINLIEKYNADISQIDYTYITDTRVFKQNSNERIKILEGKEILRHYMLTTTKTGSYSVCRCLFPIEMTEGIRFREGKTNEDQDWKFKVLKRAKRMADSNQVKYFYYQSGNSISTGALQQKNIDDGFESAEELYKLTKEEKDPTIIFLGKVKLARIPFSLLCRIAMFGIGSSINNPQELIKELTKEHRRSLFTLLKAPIPLNRKVLAILFVIDFHCVSIPIKVLKFLKK